MFALLGLVEGLLWVLVAYLILRKLPDEPMVAILLGLLFMLVFGFRLGALFCSTVYCHF